MEKNKKNKISKKVFQQEGKNTTNEMCPSVRVLWDDHCSHNTIESLIESLIMYVRCSLCFIVIVIATTLLNLPNLPHEIIFLAFPSPPSLLSSSPPPSLLFSSSSR